MIFIVFVVNLLFCRAEPQMSLQVSQFMLSHVRRPNDFNVYFTYASCFTTECTAARKHFQSSVESWKCSEGIFFLAS